MKILLGPIDEKLKFAKKLLIVASPDRFSWIPQVLARQICYCPNFFENVFSLFQNRACFFLALVVYPIQPIIFNL